MRSKHKALIIAVGGLILAAVTYVRTSTPGYPHATIQARALAFGWDLEEFYLLESNYGSRLFSSNASGLYRSKAPNQNIQISVEATQPIPFGPWQVRNFQVD